jgi:hypothetical protein
MDQDETLTLELLRERIKLAAGKRASSEVVEAIAAGFSDPSTQTRPIDTAPWEPGVVYAWRSEDADIVKAALETLDGVAGLFSGNLVGVGVGLKDLLSFWVRLRRNRVRVAEPTQVAVLLKLRQHPAGLTASALWKSLKDRSGQGGLSLDDVETSLAQLGRAESSVGPKQLVIADGQVWKSLV